MLRKVWLTTLVGVVAGGVVLLALENLHGAALLTGVALAAACLASGSELEDELGGGGGEDEDQEDDDHDRRAAPHTRPGW